MTKPHQAIPELSVDARLLSERLAKCEPDELVTYEELGKIIGIDDVREKRGLLQTARRRVLNDKQFVFAAVANEGVKRLDDHNILSVGEQAICQVHKLTRRASRKLLCAKYDSLSKVDQVTFNAHISVLGALALVTKADKQKHIAEAVEKSAKQLPMASVLELFK